MGDATREAADGFHLLGLPELLLGPLKFLALRQIRVHRQDRSRDALVVAHQGPAPLHHDRRPVLVLLAELAHPLAARQRHRGRDLEVRSVVVDERAHRATHGLGGGPAVPPLRALVPVEDPVVEIAKEDRVLGLVEQRGLLTQPGIGLLALRGTFPPP